MHKNLFYFLFFCGIAISNAQSVHQIESEFYSKQKMEKVVAQPVQMPKLNSPNKLNKVVFGFLPYWEYIAGSQKNLRYDLLTHLAVFSFEADASGNLREPLYWTWNDVKDSCSAHGVKLIATITNFNGDDIHSLITDEGKRNNLFVNIKNKIVSGGLNGVNIDFENVKTTDRPTAIGNFFSELRKYFSTINAAWEISFDSPVVNWGGWNFSSIAQNCDYMFVMGYDFYGSWSTTTGPSSPYSGTYYSISKSFSNDYSALLSPTLSQKIILGVPYYGNYWKTKTKDAYTTVDTTKAKKEYMRSVFYKEILTAYKDKEIMWDDLSKTRWLRWQDVSWNQIWYDDDSSLAIKYDFAIQKNLGGIGIWALGYDGSRTELWNLIERKFTGTVGIKDESTIPSSFQLFQNYPNPFNPGTVISFQLSVFSHVTLKVHDLLGREVATLIDEEKQPGVYSVEFRTQSKELANGIYIYTLRTSEFFQTKKMVLIK